MPTALPTIAEWWDDQARAISGEPSLAKPIPSYTDYWVYNGCIDDGVELSVEWLNLTDGAETWTCPSPAISGETPFDVLSSPLWRTSPYPRTSPGFIDHLIPDAMIDCAQVKDWIWQVAFGIPFIGYYGPLEFYMYTQSQGGQNLVLTCHVHVPLAVCTHDGPMPDWSENPVQALGEVSLSIVDVMVWTQRVSASADGDNVRIVQTGQQDLLELTDRIQGWPPELEGLTQLLDSLPDRPGFAEVYGVKGERLAGRAGGFDPAMPLPPKGHSRLSGLNRLSSAMMKCLGRLLVQRGRRQHEGASGGR